MRGRGPLQACSRRRLHSWYAPFAAVWPGCAPMCGVAVLWSSVVVWNVLVRHAGVLKKSCECGGLRCVHWQRRAASFNWTPHPSSLLSGNTVTDLGKRWLLLKNLFSVWSGGVRPTHFYKGLSFVFFSTHPYPPPPLSLSLSHCFLSIHFSGDRDRTEISRHLERGQLLRQC